MDEKSLRQRYQNSVNNAQGHLLEDYIKAACGIYRQSGEAVIEKMPEPFRVTKKHPDGTFTGRFTANAQPDFMGTLKGGQAICFEAKYTRTDRMKRNVLTETQMKKLEQHEQSGAVAGVCIGIKDKFFFVPWLIWKEMKSIYKRQYITPEDIKEYQIRFTGAIMFLDNIIEEGKK